MRMTILLVLLSLSPAIAKVHAQQIYKCSNGKDATYQSAPCAASQRTIRQWTAIPDPEPASTKLAASEARTKPESVRSSSPRRSPSGNRNARPRVDPADKRCNAAKALREEKLQTVGLKRTFDLLRKLDDAVHAACR